MCNLIFDQMHMGHYLVKNALEIDLRASHNIFVCNSKVRRNE